LQLSINGGLESLDWKWRSVEKRAENTPGSAIISTAESDDRIPMFAGSCPSINEFLNLGPAPRHRIIVPHYLNDGKRRPPAFRL
jgi:hypothetical protein